MSAEYIVWVMDPEEDPAKEVLNLLLLHDSYASPPYVAPAGVSVETYNITLSRNSLYQYEFTINGREEDINKVRMAIGRAAIQPLYFYIPRETRLRLDDLQTDLPDMRVLGGVITIIKAILLKKFRILATKIIISTESNGVRLEPYGVFQDEFIIDNDIRLLLNEVGDRDDTYEQILEKEPNYKGDITPIYVRNNLRAQILTSIEPEKYIGYTLLNEIGVDPLCWIAFYDRIHDEYPVAWQLFVEDLAGLPIVHLSHINNRELAGLAEDLPLVISRLRLEGVFSMCVESEEELDIIQELGKAFHIEEIGHRHASTVWKEDERSEVCSYWKVAKPHPYDPTPEAWLGQALDALYGRELPTVIIGGQWQLLFPPTPENLVKVKYQAILAYLTETEQTPELLCFIDQVEVLPDLSISIPVLSGENITNITTRLEGMSGDIDFYLYPFGTLGAAVAARWKFSIAFPPGSWLIVPYNEFYYLVGKIVPDTIPILDELSSNEESSEGEIREELYQYYKGLCSLDPGVSLETLLRMVIYQNTCYSPQQLEDPEERGRAMERYGKILTSFAHYGIFRLASLPGLTGKTPLCTFAPVLTGDVSAIPLGPAGAESEHDRLALTIVYKDRKEILFYYPLRSDRDIIQDMVAKLWRAGWFLSAWGQYWYRTQGELPTACFLRRIPTLSRALFCPTEAYNLLAVMVRELE